ncbi:MAG: NUDIX hydrolase [bacterium]|jgi:ADP-ribose pyrophosphatase
MYEKTISITPVFTGRLLKVETQQVELEPGVRAYREIIRHPGAIAAVARIPDGRFVFVRQFRKPIDRELLEIIAGRKEANESPEACAAREIKEETGYDVVALHSLGIIYPTPGYLDELIHLFFAELSASASLQNGDHDERITVEYLTAEEFESLLTGGMIEDSKTLAAWLLFTRQQQRLAGASS